MTVLPEGWVFVSIGDLAMTSLGKMLDKKKATGQHPTPYLRNINVRWGAFELDDLAVMDIRPEELDRVLARPGDVIACEGGEPGRAAVWRGPGTIALQKALHRIRPANGVSPDYLAYLLWHLASSGRLEALFTGSTIKHLPQEKLRRVEVPLAPEREQIRIVERLDELLSQLDGAERQLSEAARRLGYALVPRSDGVPLRRALLRQAFAGQLVPQDPSDEPASELLDRIRPERTTKTRRSSKKASP